MPINTATSGGTDRGDTIIEVLISISILGLLVTVSYGVMTRAISSAYNALDRTNTQALMNGQASVIRAMHANYINQGITVDPSAAPLASDPGWTNLIRYAVNSPTSSETTNLAKQSDGCDTPLAVDKIVTVVNMQPLRYFPSNSGVNLPDDLVRVSTVPTVGDGIWIEVYRPLDSTDSVISNVYDFYIKSCTRPIYGDGSDILRQTKTVVRLYAL